MAPIRYSDRVVYQICMQGIESFKESKLIEDVLQRMVDTGAKITRFSRTLISNYLKQLTRQRLLIRGAGEELGLSAQFRQAVDRLSRDRDFTEHSLRKDKELVKLKVHRAKNTTKKELYDENIELQEKLKNTIARLNGVIAGLTTAQGERDAALKQLDKALEELRGLRRGATPRPLTPPPGTHDDPMDVDTDENAHVSVASPSAQENVHALQRVPAVSDISALPKTPNRHPSTHSLLTPPPTRELNPRRLARTSVSLSYRDFEEQADGRPMDASGQSQAHGAPSEASGSHTPLEGSVSSTPVINAGEESFPDIQRRISRLAEQTACKEYEDRATMKDLKQQVTVARERAVGAEQRAQAAEQKAAASDAAKAESEAKLLEDIAHHNQQVADYEARLKQIKAECLEQSLLTQEARVEAAHMRQNYAVLNRRLVQAVEQSGRVSTLANVRIAELSAEVVDSLNIVYQMGQRAQDFMQGIVAGATSFAQNIAGQSPLAWQGN